METQLVRAPSMKAVLQPAYGQPDVLVVTDVPLPVVPADGVLVRVRAAGVTRGDWHLLTGTPYLVRAAYGFSRPNRPIPGMAIAGTVEAVGAAVTDLRVGDDVFGEVNRGAYAEYVCAPAKDLARAPAGLSLEDAATLPVSGTTALQGVRDAGGLQPGQSILINGAAGGVGTWAIQIAKALGGVVTAVCSARNADLVRSLGADHVIDYATTNFTAGDARYDVILDLVGNHPLAAFRRVLTPRGKLVAGAGGADNSWIGPMGAVLLGVLSNVVSSQPFVPLMNKPNRAELDAVAAFVTAGRARPVIDRRYTLSEVPAALRYLGEGRTRGKSVVTV